MHVRLQTWFPYDIQIWVNGRHILAQQLRHAGLAFVQKENAITWVEDFPRAQAMLWAQTRWNWLRLLNPFIRTVHPALSQVFEARPLAYYWSLYQSEWASDYLFRSPEYLAKIFPDLAAYGQRFFDSRSVMSFLGHRVPAYGGVHGSFKGEVITKLDHRPEGMCLHHYVDGNGMKVYDKFGHDLRMECTLANPRVFKAFRAKEGDISKKKAWLPLRKSVVDIPRRACVSHAANTRYAGALAACDSPVRLEESLGTLCRPVSFRGKRVRPFRPLDPQDQNLLVAVSKGEFSINGFRNRDLRRHLYPTAGSAADRRKASGRITRKLQLLRGHGLIKKVPHTHRYQLTDYGREIAVALIAVTKTPLGILVKAAC